MNQGVLSGCAPPVEFVQEMGEFFGAERPAEKESLHFRAVERVEEDCLRLVFDPFGNDVQPEALRQGDYRRGNCRIVGVAGDVAHERLVDLEGIDRKLLDIGEGGVPDAKIVDGYVDPQSAQATQRRDGVLDVLEHDSFGHFQFEPTGVKIRLGEDIFHHVRKPEYLELARGEINRHAEERILCILPGLVLGTRGTQHPFAERNDQSGFFRQRE